MGIMSSFMLNQTWAEIEQRRSKSQMYDHVYDQEEKYNKGINSKMREVALQIKIIDFTVIAEEKINSKYFSGKFC